MLVCGVQYAPLQQHCGCWKASQELRWTHAIEIHCTPGVSAVPTRVTLGDHQHGEVIAINEADIKEVYATRAIEGELSKGGWRRDTLPKHSSFLEPQSPVKQENFPVQSSVQWVRPQKGPLQPTGHRGHYGLGVAGLEGKSGDGESGDSGIRDTSRPHCVGVLVHECEGCGYNTG